MQANQIVSKIKPVLLKYGVRRSDLFGSVARGDFDDTSDVDILVEVPRGTSLFDMAYMQEDLQKTLGRDVDVLTYDSVNRHVKKYIFEKTLRVI